MTIAIVGVGVMGEAVLAALLRSGQPADDVLIVDARPGRVEELVGRYGVPAVAVTEAARRADSLLLVVKPADLVSTLDSLAPSLDAGTTVVSLVAGVATRVIEAHLPPGTPVVRVMPNTPALLGRGMAAVAAGTHAHPAHVERTKELLAPTGDVIDVTESALDAVTAVSGSGPAYIFYLAEAMIEGGVHLGLPRDVASQLVVQTMLGAAAMLTESGQSPTVLREQVTSPAGTTAAALAQLDASGVRAATIAAMRAARDRSRELSDPG